MPLTLPTRRFSHRRPATSNPTSCLSWMTQAAWTATTCLMMCQDQVTTGILLTNATGFSTTRPTPTPFQSIRWEQHMQPHLLVVLLMMGFRLQAAHQISQEAITTSTQAFNRLCHIRIAHRRPVSTRPQPFSWNAIVKRQQAPLLA